MAQLTARASRLVPEPGSQRGPPRPRLSATPRELVQGKVTASAHRRTRCQSPPGKKPLRCLKIEAYVQTTLYFITT
jgi:hypothetical protein